MAKTSLIVKSQRKPKFKVRGYRRCGICGRPRAVYRKFGILPAGARAPRRDSRHAQGLLVIRSK